MVYKIHLDLFSDQQRAHSKQTFADKSKGYFNHCYSFLLKNVVLFWSCSLFLVLHVKSLRIVSLPLVTKDNKSKNC